ncbi:hypothetical protein ACN27E_21255 [Mycobacterium sp. WMMD1722]|uniref:hypothetical protein n=1 Tax=Mycobacterium sp. WMMD1722 TaxID=3404117 RepID=UPI003BF4FE90
MSALALLLVAVGVGDCLRRPGRRTWPAALVSVGVVVAGAALAGLWRPGDLALVTVAVAATVGWLVLGERAERTNRARTAPLAVLAMAVAVLAALSGWASDVGGAIAGWAGWVALPGVEHVDPDRILMILGVMLVQLATGNTLVRLVLASVGAVKPASEPQPSDRLKGGRLLGPMERLLILGLGLAGQITVATAVIAAKSIIRFPEISASRSTPDAENTGGVGIDEVSEYFLVGSFASWMLALGGLALTR